MSHPVPTVGYTPFVATREDGTEILVSIFRDVDTLEIKEINVAERDKSWLTWSPPYQAVQR